LRLGRPSGGGKSSLVFGGLLPGLRKQDRAMMWDVVTLRPGKSLLTALADAVWTMPNDAGPAEIISRLEKEAAFYRDGGSHTLAQIIDRHLDGAPEKPELLLIYVDQWEELYAMAPGIAPPANRSAPPRRGTSARVAAAMRELIAAVVAAVAAIDADMRRMTRASAACRRLMTIPGVGQLTALAFVAAIDDPSRIRRSRDVGAYLGLVPRRYQSGEVDYVGSISKCGDRRVRTLLYEAANVMLTRYKGQLKLKDWAFAIAKRSTMRKARVALARRLGIIMHAMLRDRTEFAA
jgi:hypothetical protein